MSAKHADKTESADGTQWKAVICDDTLWMRIALLGLWSGGVERRKGMMQYMVTEHLTDEPMFCCHQ